MANGYLEEENTRTTPTEPQTDGPGWTSTPRKLEDGGMGYVNLSTGEIRRINDPGLGGAPNMEKARYLGSVGPDMRPALENSSSEQDIQDWAKQNPPASIPKKGSPQDLKAREGIQTQVQVNNALAQAGAPPATLPQPDGSMPNTAVSKGFSIASGSSGGITAEGEAAMQQDINKYRALGDLQAENQSAFANEHNAELRWKMATAQNEIEIKNWADGETARITTEGVERQEAIAKKYEKQVNQARVVADNATTTVSQLRKNPADFWADRGTGARILGAISMAMGAYASAMGGGPNYAMQIINDAIEQDWRKYQSKLANAENEAVDSNRRYDTIKAMYADEADQEALNRVTALKAVKETILEKKALFENPAINQEAANHLIAQTDALIATENAKYLDSTMKATQTDFDMEHKLEQLRQARKYQKLSFDTAALDTRNKQSSQVVLGSADYPKKIAARPIMFADGNYATLPEPVVTGAGATMGQLGETRDTLTNLLTKVATVRSAREQQALIANIGSKVIQLNLLGGTGGTMDEALIKERFTQLGKTFTTVDGITIPDEYIDGITSIVTDVLAVKFNSFQSTYRMEVDPDYVNYSMQKINFSVDNVKSLRMQHARRAQAHKEDQRRQKMLMQGKDPGAAPWGALPTNEAD